LHITHFFVQCHAFRWPAATPVAVHVTHAAHAHPARLMPWAMLSCQTRQGHARSLCSTQHTRRDQAARTTTVRDPRGLSGMRGRSGNSVDPTPPSTRSQQCAQDFRDVLGCCLAQKSSHAAKPGCHRPEWQDTRPFGPQLVMASAETSQRTLPLWLTYQHSLQPAAGKHHSQLGPQSIDNPLKNHDFPQDPLVCAATTLLFFQKILSA